MKLLNSSLLFGTATLFAGVQFAPAQTPPNLSLQLFAGVNITGTTGSVYAVETTPNLGDLQGPPSNPIGWKVMRGGAFDFGGSACRSASRNFFGNHPALTDWNLGFRGVLATEPQ